MNPRLAKPGVRTTEFLAIAVIVVGDLFNQYATGSSPVIALIASAIYVIHRTFIKTRPESVSKAENISSIIKSTLKGDGSADSLENILGDIIESKINRKVKAIQAEPVKTDVSFGD